jgi:OFA family oxalate/formate antiporter-like MFS transporter
VLACTAVGAAGLALAAFAGELIQLAIGYGILFGVGGGAGYIIVQQGVNLMGVRHRGLVNGYMVGLYPAGAMLAAPLFAWALAQWGVRTTIAGLAGVMLLSGVTCALLVIWSGLRLPHGPAEAASAPPPTANRGVFWLLWVVFFLAAAAGLTVLGQAAGIVRAYGGSAAAAVVATTAITGAIAAARLTGGGLVDRFFIPHVMAASHAFALTGGVLLTLWPQPLVAMVALAMVGIGYGFISGSTAGAIAFYWPSRDYGRVASRLYIAWCVAAISLPVLAGHLFDITGGYRTTVVIAACGNLAGLVLALSLPRQAQPVRV